MEDIIGLNWTNTYKTFHDDTVCIHTLHEDMISWHSLFGSMKFEPDDPMFGPARVNSMSHQIPDYQDGQTNWDVGFACVFDY